MKYRMKPVFVDAWEFDGGLDFSKTLPAEIKDISTGIRLTQDTKLRLPTPDGDEFADIGDMIIKGVHGGYYPCKPDIFAQTYEKVE